LGSLMDDLISGGKFFLNDLCFTQPSPIHLLS
jgi:hypothetical protein